ncbi:MAG: hypothetical protein O3B65_00925 [Chloroflexi bacterium]|nr:hypothetical protein [Chloroflexota bacterium]
MLIRYVGPVDLRTLIAYLGVFTAVAGTLQLPALVAALAWGETEVAIRIAVALGASVLVGYLIARIRTRDLQRREAIIATALAYPIVASVSAVAFLGHASYVDGLFESVSGLTTTGLSVMQMEQLPRSLLFLRAWLQWVGGAGIVVLSLVVLSGAGRGPHRLYISETKGENLLGSVVSTARVVIRVYVVLTVAACVALVAVGLSLEDAGLHALTAISTGGFSPYAASVGQFDSPAVEIVLMVIMTLGAVSLPLYYIAATKGIRSLFADPQLRSLLLVVASAILLFVLAAPSLGRESVSWAFNATSAVTGTGYNVGDPIAWPVPIFIGAVLFMAIGGSAGSTTGGIKQHRLGIAAIAAYRAALKPNLPEHAEIPLRYGGLAVEHEELRDIIGFILLYVFLWAGTTIALSFTADSPGSAAFEASSALGTVGLSVGITSSDMALWAKSLLMFDMWAGRLEIIPIAVLAMNLRRIWPWRQS